MKYMTIGAALLGGMMLAGGASAATCTVDGKSGATYTVTVAGSSACFSGNDTNTIETSTEIFGMTGWMLADKNDDNVVGSPLNFELAPVNGAKSGTWSILNPDNYQNVFITLKAGNGFGAFLLSAAEFMTGDWSTTKALSHASIYYAGEPSPAPVPVPAAGFLLLGGLGMLAFKRRKSA